MRTFCLRSFMLCVIALAGGILLARGDDTTNTQASGNYSPTVDFTLSNTATGAASDVVVAPFNLPSGTMNFGGVVLTGPGAAASSCGPGYSGTCPNPPSGTAPILGDVMGTLSSSTFLGVSNTPCSTNLTITFVFLNATVDNSASNLVYPSTQAQADAGGTLSPLLHDVNVVGGGSGQSQAGATSVANGLPAHVDLYPSYLNVVFDPDTPSGPNPPVQPLARYSGGQIVVGTSVVLTNQFFAPGALAAFAAPHPYFDMAGTALGYTTVSVLQDTTVEAAPTAITDFCTPLELTATTFGTSRINPCNGGPGGPNPNPTVCNNDGVINNPAPGVPTGRTRGTNPPTAGTYYYGAYQFSQRDSDGDGLENAFDSCPYNANTDGDPRTSAGPDADMLDSACDPGPVASNNNQDGDSAANGGQWTNALDNCPLLVNSDNNEFEADQLENIRRPRGGPATDSIGDVCDGSETDCEGPAAAQPHDDDGDTLINDGCPTVGSATAETTCTFSTSAEMDNDFDGYPNDGCPAVGAAESGADCENYTSQDDDNGDTVVNNSDNTNDGCPAQGGPEFGCLNSVDDEDNPATGPADGDGVINDGCPSSTNVANGHYHTDWDLAPVCIGGVDLDSDGYCATGGTGNPNDPNDNNANIIPETYSQFRPFVVAHSGSGTNPPASREPTQICSDGVDNDGDTLVDLLDGTNAGGATTDDCRPPDSAFTVGDDTDGDGSRDAAEIHMGTDGLARCGKGFETGGGPPPSDSWPADLRGDGAFTGDKVNVSDLGTYSAQGKNNKSPGQAGFDRRWDMRPGTTVGGWVGVADLAAVSSQVPQPSTGVRAFGFFSVCTAHKRFQD
jgi:hypothetical protein